MVPSLLYCQCCYRVFLRAFFVSTQPAKAGTSGDGSSAGPQLTMTEDSDNNGGMEEPMDMLDAEEDAGETHLPVEASESEDDGDPDGLADDKDDEERQGQKDSLFLVCNSPSEVEILLRGLGSLHLGQPPR